MDPWSLLNCDNDSTVNKLFTRLSQDIRLPAGEDHTVIFCLKWSEPSEVIRATWSDQNHLKWSEPLGVIRTTWSEQNHLEWSETQTRYIIQKSHMNPDRHNLLLPTLQAALHRRTPAPDPHNSCNYHSSDLFWSDDYSWTPNSDGAKYIRITSIFLTSISRSIDLHIHYMTEVTEASLYLNQPWEDK